MKTNAAVNDHPWVIVLAAGDGLRLRALTTRPDGRAVPTQFCSLDGGPTLFGQTLHRARTITPPDRVLAVVAREHRALWTPEVFDISDRNLIVQPSNRGTAAGVLLPVLAVALRDPEAPVVLLPSDHYVERDTILRTAILEALRVVQSDPTRLVLLGFAPGDDTPDLGWILPAEGPTRLNAVERLVEKPPPPLAADLRARGGLWNALILATRARTLCHLFEERLPRLAAALRRANVSESHSDAVELRSLYDRIEERDFSRDVLQGGEHRLRVLEVPPCGWTDLGTPQRVARCLRTLQPTGTPHSRVSRSRPVLADALQAYEFPPRKQRSGDPRRGGTRATAGAKHEPPPCIWQG